MRAKVLALLISSAIASALAIPATADLTYADFTGAAGLQLNGDAAVVSNVLRLTPDEPFQAGSAFATDPQQVRAGFSTTFTFRITAPAGPDEGADGIAFVIQRDAAGAG